MLHLENWQKILQNFRKTVFWEVTHGLFTFSLLSLLAVHELHGRSLFLFSVQVQDLGKVHSLGSWQTISHVSHFQIHRFCTLMFEHYITPQVMQVIPVTPHTDLFVFSPPPVRTTAAQIPALNPDNRCSYYHCFPNLQRPFLTKFGKYSQYFQTK